MTQHVNLPLDIIHYNDDFGKLSSCGGIIDEQPSRFLYSSDSFLTTRSAHDNEATRMMKTQFMALWDGLLSEPDNRILVIGATNRPMDLDSAILRRLPYKVTHLCCCCCDMFEN